MMKEEYIALTKEAFDKLMEYSISIPTGAVLGKQWKRNANSHGKSPEWYLCEFVKHPNPDFLSIQKKKIVIREAGLKANEVNGKDENYQLWKDHQER